MASDEQFTRNLVLGSARDQAQRAGTCPPPDLPKPDPMNDEQEQLAKNILEYAHIFDTDPKFEVLVDDFARAVSRQSFQRLVDKVFAAGITFGKILVLVFVVGRVMARMNGVSAILSWTLNYFRDHLLTWICSRGGWIKMSSLVLNSTSNLTFLSSVYGFICTLFLPFLGWKSVGN